MAFAERWHAFVVPFPHTGRPIEQIEHDMIRDFFMSAEEAKSYGLIDNVISNRGDLVDPQVIASQAAGVKL